MAKAFEVRNLRFRYPKGEMDVIKGISFDIEEGKIVGLLGPSGAGKSTTQKILIKLLNQYEGEIHYFGKNLKALDKSFYEEVGVGFEAPVHFNKLTGLQNLRYFANLYKNNADYVALLERLNLADAKDQEVSQYSKGMKVRLNFARALLNNPKMLFLDEPTNGLDPTNAKIVKDMIKEYKQKGHTVFITTHLMQDVEELCDNVVFMRKGEISELSTPRELKLRYGKRLVEVEYRNSDELKKDSFMLDGLGENDEFLSLLKKETIETIHSKETSLDEIFIKVTSEEKE